MEQPGPDPIMLLLRFIGWGLLIFLVFRLLRFAFPYILVREKLRKQVMKYFPVVELITWMLYLSWFVFRFYEAEEIFVVVTLALLLVLLFWISRYWIRDLVAGVIFRSSTRLKSGDNLQFDEMEGTIRKFGSYSVELETRDNQLVYIPYSKLVDTIHIKSERTGHSQGYTFELECSSRKEIPQLIRSIRTIILATPWVSVTRMPVIHLKEQKEGNYRFDITVFPTEKSLAAKIEQRVKERISHPRS